MPAARNPTSPGHLLVVLFAVGVEDLVCKGGGGLRILGLGLDGFRI